MKTTILIAFLLIQTVLVFAQPKALNGYEKLLNQFKLLEDNDVQTRDSLLNELIGIAINDKNRELILPFEVVTGKDTVIYFQSTVSLRKRKFRNITFRVNEELFDSQVFKIQKDSLRQISFDIDSIYHYMDSNMTVNIDKFNIDTYFNSDVSNYDTFCVKADNMYESFSWLYSFFLQGVILMRTSANIMTYVPY